jgi:TRAP-type mannitol/chloroaromatic compound transport system permease small subunit
MSSESMIGVPWMIVIGTSLVLLLSVMKVGLIRTADGIKWFLEKIAFGCGWLLILLMFITCMDIVFRRLQLPIALTQFQEAEWHLHTAIFSSWLGYNYVINAHPRVDSYTESQSFRTKAWIELWGVALFALPFMYVMVQHGWPFVVASYLQNEASENVTGLPYRWAIKGIFFIGLCLVMLAIVSVLMRLIAYLFRKKSQEDVDLQIGHSELEA